MPSVFFGSGAYKRGTGSLPPLELINMYVESAKTSENEVCLQSRNGLGLLATNGAGPINGLFANPGTLSGDVFSISGSALYRGTSAIASGTIAGTGVARWAGSNTELVVTRGGVPRSYNGTNIADIVFPDTANVRWVTFIGSLFVFGRDSTAKFYWSDPLDGRTVNALSFATAEREADNLLDGMALGDNLWLFGENTVEAWSHTGDADLPFRRLENVAFDKGIHSTGCVVKADNSLVFVAHNCAVYRVSDVPQLISDSWLTEKIKASSSVRLFTYWLDDHELVALRLDDATYVIDLKTGEWHENRTDGGQWIAAHACMVGDTAYFGHQTTGQLMGWSEWDDMGDEMERRFSFAAPLDEPLSIDRLNVWCNSGHTELLSGQGSDPTIEIRMSDDAGNTFDDWEGEELGIAGAYRQYPEWRGLGMFDAPGVIGECRVTDPVPFRVSAVKINEAGRGRQRV